MESFEEASACTDLAELDQVHFGHLAELNQDPLVSLALVLEERVSIAVKDGLGLARLLVGRHNLRTVLRQCKVVPILFLLPAHLGKKSGALNNFTR